MNTIDPHWFTTLLFIIQFLIAVVVALIGFFMRQVVNDLKTVTRELRDLQISIPTSGVMREHFEEYRRETRGRIHDLADRIGAIEGAWAVVYKFDLPKRTSGG